MLKMTNAKKMSAKLCSGEIMHYIPVPKLPYAELQADFDAAPHLGAIGKLDLREAGGILLKCHYMEDGLLAASYLFKKFEEESVYAQRLAGEPLSDEEYPMDFDDEEEDEGGGQAAEAILRSGNRIVHLPVIPALEFVSHLNPNSPFSAGFGAFHARLEGETKTREPYWMKGNHPLIVEDHGGMHLHAKKPFEHFAQTNRFLVYVISGQRDFMSALEKSILFETNMEYCVLEKPTTPYFERLLDELAKACGYRIGKAVNKSKLVKDLMDYRGSSFRSCADLETLVNKAIHKKRDASRTISQSDFDAIFITREARKTNAQSGKRRDAASELDGLIGLDEVKAQLRRALKRMKFDKMRRNNGYAASDTHMAAVFMGNPGTAKTTVARIFGSMLCEEGVLAHDIFREVARKDLIGKYVGWTAPAVAALFEETKGGTIFIDEAYGLLSEGMPDGYSEEALSELVRQMENNPDTLVIFAGYPDKMRTFIQHANPGLRSRLTNVIEFQDYDAAQLWEIFAFFAAKEEYVLDKPDAIRESIARLVRATDAFPSRNLGNGRLIRRLFKTAVGYMAERDDNDLRTLLAIDVDKAAQEILRAEQSLMHHPRQTNAIGFHP